MNPSLLEIAGHIADMKDVDYKNTLAVAVILELLMEKGLISKEEFTAKAIVLDELSLTEELLS
ncbi:MAG: hypothetical protein H6Q74_2654 [Firmicutes bacterium]|nr:hypothetical protein [Bacillota bacterium]